MHNQEDSFQQYRNYLQDSIGEPQVKAPPKPITPYQRYMFERVCQQKSKGNKNISEVNRMASQEWKKLQQSKKQYYNKTYQIRQRQREDLQNEYEFLTQKKKPVSGYVLFFKKRFQQLKISHSSLTSAQLSVMASEEWKAKSQGQKQRLNKQAANKNEICEMSNEQREMRIQQYHEKVQQFMKQLRQEKQKISRKYGVEDKRQQMKQQKKRKREQLLRMKKGEKKKEEQQKKQKKNGKKKEKGQNIKKQQVQGQQQTRKQCRIARQIKKELKNLTTQLKVQVKIQPTTTKIATKSTK